MLFFCSLVCLLGKTQHFFLFAGTYTGNGSKGIYIYDFDAKNGTVLLLSHTDSADNPSYLCISAKGNYLYAVNEVDREKTGKVSAYRFDRATAKLELINQQQSGGAHPCHISITRDGKMVFVANYTGGSLASFPIDKSGALLPAVQQIQHSGKSVDSIRQAKAHVHAVSLSPDEKYLLTPDLGTDKIHVYRYNSNAAKVLTSGKVGFIKCTPGSGPRQLCFSSNGKRVYVVEELTGMLTVYSFQGGVLKKLKSYSGHPPGAGNNHGSADIQLSPDGKFLYMSNRGEENSISIFKVDLSTGLLIPAGIQSTGGKHPRNMLIDPTGRYLLVGNMKSNEVVIFRRNAMTGAIQEQGRFSLASPACLKMFSR